MSTFVVVVGIVAILLVLVMQYAQSQQERAVWKEFASDELAQQSTSRTVAGSPQPETLAGASTTKKPSRQRQLMVSRIEDESPDCRSFYFTAPDHSPLPPFFGGQFLTVSLPDPQVPQRLISRCYSLSDGVREQTYRITVKRVPGDE